MNWGSLKTKRPSVPFALQRKWLPMLELPNTVLRNRKLFGVVSIHGGWCLAEPLASYGKNCGLGGQRPRAYPTLSSISYLALYQILPSGAPSLHQKARDEDRRRAGEGSELQYYPAILVVVV